MYRTHTCGELTLDHVGTQVTLAGWIHNLRDMGGLFFLDLRDRYGVTQVSYNPQDDGGALSELLSSCRHEYCMQISGEVVARPSGQTNHEMSTGAIEVVLRSVTVLTKSKVLPFPIVEDPATSEEQRFTYRYLDLRRRPILNNIEFRARMNHFTRNWFTGQGFLEVQTPIFTVSSPEGARDYVIPSRVNPGKFYALPQAPQQYKQLLMVGGVDKYFQIAPCFRDEDPRADRHSCEFYQIDAEMSFVHQEDIFAVVESFTQALISSLVPDRHISVSFPHISYHDALRMYGSDKPDLRFGMKFIDLSEIVGTSGFSVFADAIQQGGVVQAIKLDQQSLTRKELDQITDVAKQAGAGGLAYLIFEQEQSDVEYIHAGIRSPIAKFLSGDEIQQITQATGAESGDVVFFGAGPVSLVQKVLNKVRLYCRDTYNLVNPHELAFCWIVDFPFYEYDESNDRWDFGHNPFSHIVGGVSALKTDNFADIQTNQYDLVLNGYEILSGSIRNHDPEVMVAAFEKLGLSEQDIKEKFGAMYEAFQYGAPPHGGFAFGFDRLMMILLDEPNIRECYAFPKSGKAEDVMMGAPSVLDQYQLDDLHIDLQKDN